MNDDSTAATAATAATSASIETIDAATLATHVEAGDAFVLDLRRHPGGVQMYGAIRYDPKKLDAAPRLILPLPKNDGLVVLYDEHGTSDALMGLAAKIRDNGYGRVVVLDGGYAAWEAAHGRTEERTLEQPVPIVSEHQIAR